MALNGKVVLKKIRSAKDMVFGSKPWKFTSENLLSMNPAFSMYSIGKFSYGTPAPNVVTFAENEQGENGTLKIGSFCSFAVGVTILLGGEHSINWVSTYPFGLLYSNRVENKASNKKADVTVGNDVWIGTNAFILSGVEIGDGAVVGACSVVTKDVEPYSIVAGNPARLIRKRFDEETIKQLLKIKWWDWDTKRVKENLPLIRSDKIKEFVEKNKCSETN
jgi:acetyltransferase-like isoleucine patch superfamily enzyme